VRVARQKADVLVVGLASTADQAESSAYAVTRRHRQGADVLAIQVHETNPTATPAEEPHFEAAVLALRQAAQQDKHNSTILYNLATCLATCGRHGVATRIWDATISLSSEDSAPLNGKAVSLIALNEFDAASALLMRAREISPAEQIILRNLRRLRPTV